MADALLPRNVAIAGDLDLVDTEEDALDDLEGDGEIEDEAEAGAEDDEDMEDEDGDIHGDKYNAPIPSNLREISSLASWTVSTHKPGCGIAALRHPSPTQYWQSDGPQPHHLTLHFFKRVAIVRLRVYLDFDLDESYTPTKMVFLAGMGGNDLVEFATWQGESPVGWVDINLEGVGGRDNRGNRKRRRRQKLAKSARSNTGAVDDILSDYDMDDDLYDDELDGTDDDSEGGDDPSAGNVLKAMVLQVKISENHQNGKDTHVRGFQVFARDDRRSSRTRRDDSTRKSTSRKITADLHDMGVGVGVDVGALGEHEDGSDSPVDGFSESDWMREPEIR